MHLRVYAAGIVAAASLLSGCATGPAKTLTSEEFARHYQESEVKVDRLLSEGKRDEAIGVLTRSAALSPTSKEPWARMAKIHFDAGDYGNAIVAADEVLQRDPADRTAKSMCAVSGLRVAATSLNDLRHDEKLVGSAREDAVQLAKVLRETLGESVLIPPPSKEQLEREAAEARKRTAAAARKPRPAATPAKPAAAAHKPAQATTGDPFGALR